MLDAIVYAASDLRRELMRQRGYFAYAASHYQTHQ